MTLIYKLTFSAALRILIADSKDTLRSFSGDSWISRSLTTRRNISRNMECLQLWQKLQELMSILGVKKCSNVSLCCCFRLLKINL